MMVRAAIVLLLLALMPSAAQAEKRIALLIGNQSYTSEIGRLANPHNDIALLEQALKGLGFEVTTVRDAGLAALHQAVNGYARRVQAAGPNAVAFFYYSGHGAADAGTNYLIPVDVKTTETGELWDQSLQLTEITRKLKRNAGNATHFVVFDACRNTLKLKTPGSRALVQSKGFVPVSQESGMLIAYATAEGELATDVGVDAGPYAKALAEEIVKPGVEAVYMFRRVQVRVRATIGQEPWLGFSALGEVHFAGIQSEPPKPVATPAPTSEASQAWSLVRETSDIRALEAFRRQYGAANLFFDRLAEARIEDLKKQQVAVATPPPAPKPVPSKPAEPAAAVTPTRPVRCLGVEVTVGANDHRCLRAGDGKTVWFKDCPTCPEMVVAPTGRFTMGSPKDEPGRNNDREAQILVTIAKPFAVGRFAVTRGEFAAFVAATGYNAGGGCTVYTSEWKQLADHSWQSPGFAQNDRHPVVCVTWNAAKSYVAWLSSTTSKTYRLLSETEREYVARAGTTTPFWWGATISTREANYTGNDTLAGASKGESRKATVAVDSFSSNPWGLYNVHGNVWEWTEDCWNDSNNGNPGNGNARTTGNCESRVLRGGSFINDPQFLRSALRYRGGPGLNFGGGFRVARTLD